LKIRVIRRRNTKRRTPHGGKKRKNDFLMKKKREKLAMPRGQEETLRPVDGLYFERERGGQSRCSALDRKEQETLVRGKRREL